MPAPRALPDPADLLIIGGGVNGCGIARDAAGRGLSVILVERDDLAQATSSASTKMFHGGLRYLDYLEFRLVREALTERETLLTAMPHIAWPMRFVVPVSAQMRFAMDTPVSRLLGLVMPWARGRRPAWLIRMGLFLYDHLGGRKLLPASRALDLTRDEAGQPLRPEFRRGFEYSDCFVLDSRLVVLNARDAEARGAAILTRTRAVSARRITDPQGPLWEVVTEGAHGRQVHRARALVNAAGPWVDQVIRDVAGLQAPPHVRLVRGSHIVTRRLYPHERCYFLQGDDGRVVFAIPYEQDFTLIGTTDADHDASPDAVRCTEAERDYLCACASRYFARPVTPADVVHDFAGVRPLYDDGARSATAATRDYVLELETEGAPLLNVFGGKITTYRRLAEKALAQLAPHLPQADGPWTARVALPGGDFPPDGVPALIAQLQKVAPFLGPARAQRLVRNYGTDALALIGAAREAADLGRDFGAGLTEAEVDWLMRHEYAQTAADVLWRRTRLGLHLDDEQVAELAAFMAQRMASGAAAPADDHTGAA